MSSLEERREARRRRRQQEESELNGTEAADLDERLARRRAEREARLQRIAAGLNSINGEDELEIRRRERREQRLRGSTDTAAEETTSRRSRRNRGEDTETTDDTPSLRSRRRRGYDDDEDQVDYSAPAAEEESTPQEDPEEAARKQREQEEEEERQRQEDARRREEEEERRRQQEERRRQEEEEERRRAEEEEYQRQQQEKEEKEQLAEKVDDSRQDNLELFIDEDSWRGSHDNSVTTTEDKKLESNGDNLYHGKVGKEISIEIQISDKNKISVENDESGDWKKRSENEKCGRLKSFFEDEMDKTKEQTPQPVKRQTSKSRSMSASSTSSSIDDNQAINQVQDRVLKFQTSVEDNQKVGKISRPILSPGADKLKDIQKKFDVDSSQSGSGQGKSGAKETQLNGSVHKKTEKSAVLNRWQPAPESNKPTVSKNSPNLKTVGKISSIASKFDHAEEDTNKTSSLKDSKLEKTPRDTKSVRQSSVLEKWQHNQEETITPSSARRQQNEPASSTASATKVQQQKQSATLPKVASRWQPKPTSPPVQKRMVDTKMISTGIKVSERWRFGETKTSPRRTISNSSSTQDINETYEEEERRERERLEEEEREREEAARRMEEEQKKKRKRKGLGGLSPEKKKMLKDEDELSDEYDEEHDDKENLGNGDGDENGDKNVNGHTYTADDSVNEEKWLTLQQRITPLPNDFDSMSRADLQRLCKKLHAKVAQLEEEVYDWEVKIRKQDFEINELALKVNDSKGKFIKPVLRKVNKTENKLGKLVKKDKADFRENLKSTGQNKFALDEEEEKTTNKQPDWRENLKKGGEGEDENEVEVES